MGAVGAIAGPLVAVEGHGGRSGAVGPKGKVYRPVLYDKRVYFQQNDVFNVVFRKFFRMINTVLNFRLIQEK